MSQADVSTAMEQKKYAFIRLFTLLGRHGQACKRLGIDRTLPYYWASVDEDYARAFERAKVQAKAVLLMLHEEAFDERSIDGVNKPITYQGEVKTTYKEYDTTAGIVRCKKLDPAGYKDNYKVEVDASESVRNLMKEIEANRNA